MDFSSGDIINIPHGTKYFLTYDEYIKELPLDITGIIDRIEDNFVYLEYTYIVILLDSLKENLLKQDSKSYGYQESIQAIMDGTTYNTCDIDSISFNDWEEDKELTIGDMILIPKGIIWKDTFSTWHKLECDIQGTISDMSLDYLWISNFDGRFLRCDIKTEMTISPDILNQKVNINDTYDASDGITTKYNIWTTYKQNKIDKIYKYSLDKDSTRESDIEADLWGRFLEYYYNRQYKNNIINGGN